MYSSSIGARRSRRVAYRLMDPPSRQHLGISDRLGIPRTFNLSSLAGPVRKAMLYALTRAAGSMIGTTFSRTRLGLQHMFT